MEKHVKTTLVLLLVITLLLLSACSGNPGSTSSNPDPSQSDASAEDPEVTLTLGLAYNVTTDFRGEMMIKFKEFVESSNGNITVTLYPNEQLVKNADAFSGVSSGTVDMYFTATSYFTGFIPDLQFGSLPFPNPKLTDADLISLYENEKVKPLLQEQFNANNIQHIGTFGSEGVAEFYFNKPIKSFDEMTGLKLRVASGKTSEAIQSMGNAVVSMGSAEQYLALQTSTIDGCATNSQTYLSNSLYEVAPYRFCSAISKNMFMLICNLDKWNKLTENQQQIIIDAQKAAEAWRADNVGPETEKTLAEVASKAKESYTPTYEEWKKFTEEIVKPIEDEFKANSGELGNAFFEARDELYKKLGL